MGRGTTAATAHRSLTRGAAPSDEIGSRVRELRVAAGMTQADLAGERFSKEYVSQVELGKSPPSEAGIRWFCERLGVDRSELEGDHGPAAVAAAEAAIVRAEAAIEAHRHSEAVAALDAVGGAVSRAAWPSPATTSTAPWRSTGSASSASRWGATRPPSPRSTRPCAAPPPPSV